MRRFLRILMWLLAALYVCLALLMLLAPNGRGGDVFFVMAVVPTMFAVFFLPTIVAYRRKHPYRAAVLGLNLVVGETGIGWFVLMGIAMSGRTVAQRTKVS